MQNNKSYINFIVGLFVLFGLGCVFYLAFQVSGLDSGFKGKHYEIQAEFSDIGGLSSRSRVSVAGVVVGNVKSISINPETQNAIVTMQIHEGVNYLSTDTVARILTAGLLGEKYVGLLSGSDDEMLSDGDTIEDTQGSLVLEDLISKFLVSKGSDSK